MLLVVTIIGAGAVLYIDKQHKDTIDMAIVSITDKTVTPTASSTAPDTGDTSPLPNSGAVPSNTPNTPPTMPTAPVSPGQPTPKPVEGGVQLAAPVLTGVIKSVNTGCFSDGECSVMVGESKVVLLIGRYRGPLGKIIGADSIGDLENMIGSEASVYSKKDSDGVYTLLGDESFYLKVIAKPVAAGSCAVGGCSSQLCGEAADMNDMVTTCEYQTKYSCYQKTTCARQVTGKCGWTETPELLACLKDS